MKTGIVIQARMNSSRLPDKVLLEFCDGKSILEIIIRRLKKNFNNHDIVVATSNNDSDDFIEKLSNDLDVFVYRGDELNVLDRFIETSRLFNFDALIRICADNPFILTEPIRQLIQKGDENPEADYISFKLSNEKPTILTHIGLFAEWVKVSALEKTANKTSDEQALEHVTRFIYNHPTEFRILLLKAPEEVFNKVELRFTVDTYEDFENAKKLYQTVCKDRDMWSTNDLLTAAESDKEILLAMKKEITKNEK